MTACAVPPHVMPPGPVRPSPPRASPGRASGRRSLRHAGQIAVSLSPCRTPRCPDNTANVPLRTSCHLGGGSTSSRTPREPTADDLFKIFECAATNSPCETSFDGKSNGTFLTADPDSVAAGLGMEFEEEELFHRLQEAADAALYDKNKKQTCTDSPSLPTQDAKNDCGSHESEFLQRLHAAHKEALEAGDVEAADAVADAIRLEKKLNSEFGGESSQTEQPSGSMHHQKMEASPRRASGLPQISPRTKPQVNENCTFARPHSRDQHLGRPRPLGTVAPSAHPCCDLPKPRRTPKSARSRRQEHIAAQLACEMASSASKESAAQEPPDDEQKSTEYQGPMHLGKICHSSIDANVVCFRRAADAELQRRKSGGIKTVKGLDIQMPCVGTACSDNRQKLPPSDIPSSCRAVITSWANGYVSGHRCLLEVVSAGVTRLATGTLGVLGRASWQTLTLLCGMVGGEELFATNGIRVDVFARPPSRCLHDAFQAVRAEAGIDGQLTLEELHLGLRSFELGARGAGNNSAQLQSVVWRELLRAYLEDPATTISQEDESPAKALARALELGAAGIEREARALPLEELRTTPASWDSCRVLLASVIRALRADLDTIETCGPYAIIGVDPNASDAEIRQAYRDLCLRHHPDKGGDTATFQSLQQAHDKIVQDRKRGVRPPISKQNAGTKPENKNCRGASRDAAATMGRKTSKSTHTKQSSEESDAKHTGQQDNRTESTGPSFDTATTKSVVEVLHDVERLHTQATDGAEHAEAACEAAKAAAVVINAVVSQPESAEGYEMAWDAVRSLLNAMNAIREGTEAAASAATETSTRVVAIGVLGENGDCADALVDASLLCGTTGKDAANAVVACEAFASEVAEALHAAKDNCFMDADAGVDGAISTGLQLLSSTARHGEQVGFDAATAAAKAARATAQALSLARTAAPHASTHSHRSCSRSRAAPSSRASSRERHTDDKKNQHFADRKETPSPTEAKTESAYPPRRPRTPHDAPPSNAHGSRARSNSAGHRGRNEAFMRRRLDAFEELMNLNNEACKLQRQLHDAILQNPFLMFAATSQQRVRIFEVVIECLHQTVMEFRKCTASTADDLLRWLHASVACDVALLDVRNGALRLAALVDIHAVTSVLTEHFLPSLLEVRPHEEVSVKAIVTAARDGLHAWVARKLS